MRGGESWVLALSTVQRLRHVCPVASKRPGAATSPPSKRPCPPWLPPEPWQPTPATLHPGSVLSQPPSSPHTSSTTALVKVGTCHLQSHLHRSALGATDRRSWDLNRTSSCQTVNSLSPAESVCIWASTLPMRKTETSEVSVFVCHCRSGFCQSS